MNIRVAEIEHRISSAAWFDAYFLVPSIIEEPVERLVDEFLRALSGEPRGGPVIRLSDAR